MSPAQRQTHQRQFSTKGAKEVHMVEALRGPMLGGMFGRLYNVKQCDYCGADLTFSLEIKGVLLTSCSP